VDRDSGVAANLTVPLADTTNLTLSAPLSSSPSFGLQLHHATPSINATARLDVANSFRSLRCHFDGVFIPSPLLHVGGFIGFPTGIGVATQCNFFKQTIGFSISTSGISVGVWKRIHPRTVAAVAWELSRDGKSEARLGCHRGFLMSVVSFSISSQGIVQSLYQRHVKEGLALKVSSYANHRLGAYSFGVGLDITNL
jgi:hypothetical protein